TVQPAACARASRSSCALVCCLRLNRLRHQAAPEGYRAAETCYALHRPRGLNLTFRQKPEALQTREVYTATRKHRGGKLTVIPTDGRGSDCGGGGCGCDRRGGRLCARPRRQSHIAPRPGRAWDGGSEFRKRRAHRHGAGTASTLLGPPFRILARIVCFRRRARYSTAPDPYVSAMGVALRGGCNSSRGQHASPGAPC